jgi:hypothetical protein
MRRSPFLRFVAGACVAASVLAACADAPTQPRAPGAGPAARQVAPAHAEADGDLPTLPRFTLDVAAEGSLRPGTPITVRATVRANLATRSADVRLVMPEFEIAKGNGWRIGRGPTGVALPARAQRTRALAAGEQVTLVDQVVIPSPGYYRVALRAVQRSDEPVVEDGRWVPTSAYKEVWLLVDEGGGRVTPTFDPALLPDSVLPQPGLRQPRRGPPGRRGDSSASTADRRASRAGAVEARPTNDGLRLRRVVYYNPDTDAVEPVPGVTIRWDIYDGQYGTHTQNGSAVSDGGGYFDPPCMASYEQMTGSMTMSGYAVLNWSGGYGDGGCDAGVQQFYLPSGESWLYVHLNNFAPWAHGLLAQSRGPVAVWHDRGLDGARYNGGSDRITIGREPYIYGDFGRFTLAHEYGHAFHEKALSGNAASGQCPNPHYLNGYYNLECAFSEGFANFMGAASQNIWDVYAYYIDIVDYTNRPWYNAGADGSIQEAAVGALLYDMADGAGGDGGASEPWDGVGGPYQVALTIKQCVLRTASGYVTRPRGIDHFVYCAERNIDSGVRSAYFNTRSATWFPTAIVGNANYTHDWPTEAVRPVWRKDLYGLD